MFGFSLTLTLSRWEREGKKSPGPLGNAHLFDCCVEMAA